MSDKEVRRRKKRKDSQSKKVHFPDELQAMFQSRSDSKDSDCEVEEEVVSPPPQAGGFVKLIFIILSLGLLVSMSLLFLSLNGAERGPVNIYDDGHSEEPAESHSHHDDEEALLHETKDDDQTMFPSLESIFSFGVESSDEEASEDKDIDSPEDLPETDDGSISKESDSVTENFDATSSMPIFVDEQSLPEKKENIVDDFSTTQIDAETDTNEVEDDDEEDSLPNESVPDEVSESKKAEEYEKSDITNVEDYEIRQELDEIEASLQRYPTKSLKKCQNLLITHPQSPRLHFLKARALDVSAELERSNKLLEESIDTYASVLKLPDVPEKLYLLAGKKAADRLRFRGFITKSIKLILEMINKYPKNIDLQNDLAVGYLYIDQNEEAKKVLSKVLKMAPKSGFAKVHLGFILKLEQSDLEKAIRLLQEGIATRENGVIDGRFYLHLGDALLRTGRVNEALKVHEEGVKEGLFLSVYQRSLYNVNGLTGTPWWNPYTSVYSSDFKALEDNWEIIRDEGQSLVNKVNSGFIEDREGLKATGQWKQLDLFTKGRRINENCNKAPKTCALISQMTNAAFCKRGQVKFSVLSPNTHIWSHTGPTNVRLRSHLGLIVPKGTSLRVANETRSWKEGKVLLFDDSFEHEVWNNSTEPRLVLIVDFWHPELTKNQKMTLTPM